MIYYIIEYLIWEQWNGNVRILYSQPNNVTNKSIVVESSYHSDDCEIKVCIIYSRWLAGVKGGEGARCRLKKTFPLTISLYLQIHQWLNE